MTALTKDILREYELGDINEFLVEANTIIYAGAAVGLNEAGYARGLKVGDKFAGFADRHANNTEGTDGETRIGVKRRGFIVLDIAGIGMDKVGSKVYASDDNSFTLSSSGDASLIGNLVRYIDNVQGLVEFIAHKDNS
jgi:hypothetical protein